MLYEGFVLKHLRTVKTMKKVSVLVLVKRNEKPPNRKSSRITLWNYGTMELCITV